MMNTANDSATDFYDPNSRAGIRRATLDDAIRRVEAEAKMVIQPIEGEWYHNALEILRQMRDE